MVCPKSSHRHSHIPFGIISNHFIDPLTFASFAFIRVKIELNTSIASNCHYLKNGDSAFETERGTGIKHIKTT